jgi:hypothetical protein
MTPKLSLFIITHYFSMAFAAYLKLKFDVSLRVHGVSDDHVAVGLANAVGVAEAEAAGGGLARGPAAGVHVCAHEGGGRRTRSNKSNSMVGFDAFKWLWLIRSLAKNPLSYNSIRRLRQLRTGRSLLSMLFDVCLGQLSTSYAILRPVFTCYMSKV